VKPDNKLGPRPTPLTGRAHEGGDGSSGKIMVPVPVERYIPFLLLIKN